MRKPAPGRVPNYGRSFQLQTLYGTEQEVARVDLDAPRDITIMLGDSNSIYSIELMFMPVVTILYGSGGIGNVTQRLNVPIRGSVFHVCASNVVVRAVLPQSEAVAAYATARFSAMIGFGRPSRGQTVAGEGNDQQYFDVGAEGQIVKLLPWTTHVQILTRTLGVAPPTVAPTFKWLNWTGDDATAVELDATESTVTVDPTPIPYVYANAIQLLNGDAEAYRANVVQHWQL